MSRLIFVWPAAIFVLMFLGWSGCSPSGESGLDEEKEPNYLAGRSRKSAQNYTGAIEAFERRVAAAERELAEGAVVRAPQLDGALQTDFGFLPIEIVEPGVGTGAIGIEDAIGSGDIRLREVLGRSGSQPSLFIASGSLPNTAGQQSLEMLMPLLPIVLPNSLISSNAHCSGFRTTCDPSSR